MCISGENQLSPSLIGISPLSTTSSQSFQPSGKSVLHGRLTCRFSLAMIDHYGFGFRPMTNLVALFRPAFATASPHGLTSPLSTNSAGSFFKGTLSPRQARLQRIGRQTVSGIYFTPPGVLFTFPSRYLSAIGHQGIFRLTGGPARFIIGISRAPCYLG